MLSKSRAALLSAVILLVAMIPIQAMSAPFEKGSRKVVSKEGVEYFATWEEIQGDHLPLVYAGIKKPLSRFECDYNSLTEVDGRRCEDVVHLVITPSGNEYHVSVTRRINELPW